MTPAGRRSTLLIAIVTATALIFSSPFAGQIRAALRSTFPGHFSTLIGAAVAAAVAIALLIAAVRIRKLRALRYLALVAAVALGIAYARAFSTGNADVDVVEDVHFLQYGIVTLLFYRSWRSRSDLSVLLFPLLAGLLVGTLDEWFQWFTPARVGEMRDVFLDGVATACGLLFSIGVDPPDRLALTIRQGSWVRTGTFVSVVICAFAVFLQTVHMGYALHDPEIGTFLSRYTSDDLDSAARDRIARWREHPPLTWRRLSREDQYMSEGLWHVQRRNQAWAAGNIFVASRENRILERFYRPVLDTPSYVSASGHRWAPGQHADAERRAGADSQPYVSDAAPYPIYTWRRPLFWASVALLICVILAACVTLDRGRPFISPSEAVEGG